MERLVIFGLGVLVGAGAATYGPSLSRNVRPLVKEAIKAAVQMGHGARVRGAGLMEALEDIYAEAVAEAAAPPPRKPKRKRAKSGRHTATRRRASRAKAVPTLVQNA